MPAPKYPSNYNNSSMLQSVLTWNDESESYTDQNRVNFVKASSKGFTGYVQSGANFQAVLTDTTATFHDVLQQLLTLQGVMPNLGGVCRLLEPVGVTTTTMAFFTGIQSSTATYIYLTTPTGVGGTLFIDGQTIVPSWAGGVGGSTIGGGTSSRILINISATGSAATWNGVWSLSTTNAVTGMATLIRSYDMTYATSVIYGSMVVTLNGTKNKGTAYYVSSIDGTPGDYYSNNRMAVGSNVIGFSTYYPLYSPNYAYAAGPGYAGTQMLLTGTEFTFMANHYLAKFNFMEKRNKRMAYWLTKFAQNVGVGASVTALSTDIGYSTNNDLPANSRYPSSYNRGWK